MIKNFNTIFETIEKSSIRFCNDERGNLAIIAAISVLPILISVGAAVDYSRHHHRQVKLASALDAAVLAAAKGLSNGGLNYSQVKAYVTVIPPEIKGV